MRSRWAYSSSNDVLAKLADRSPAAKWSAATVEAGRFNVFAHWGDPLVTLSTHMDTVPPFFPSREDAEFIWGRGSADAKGIIAVDDWRGGRPARKRESAISACSLSWARSATAPAPTPRRTIRADRASLINGEPTENKLALATKGMLRYEIEARGKLAHSAYPELGESAIDKLARRAGGSSANSACRRIRLLGPTTLNIGVISGGRAPNVIPDAATAEIAIRLVGDPEPVRREAMQARGGDRAEAREILCIPAMRFRLAGRIRDVRGRVHHRRAGVRGLVGQAFLARAGEYSRGAHQ